MSRRTALCWYLGLFSESFKGLKGRLEAWKGSLELNDDGSENVGKISEEGNFPCTVCRKALIPSSATFAGVGFIRDVVC